MRKEDLQKIMIDFDLVYINGFCVKNRHKNLVKTDLLNHIYDQEYVVCPRVTEEDEDKPYLKNSLHLKALNMIITEVIEEIKEELL